MAACGWTSPRRMVRWCHSGRGHHSITQGWVPVVHGIVRQGQDCRIDDGLKQSSSAALQIASTYAVGRPTATVHHSLDGLSQM